MYLLLDIDMNCDLLHNRPLLLTGRTPHDKQNRNCLNLVMSLRGAQIQDGLTDWLTDCQLQSNSMITSTQGQCNLEIDPSNGLIYCK
jgi:hypothetical protein